MKWTPVPVTILLLLVACKEVKPPPRASVHQPSVFEVVISDLVAKEAPVPKFVGSKAMVLSRWNKGNSLFYALDEELKVGDELLEAFQSASASKDPFPSAEMLGPNVALTTDRPHGYLSYYGDKLEPVQARCFVAFWRPGYSKDHKRAIVRAWYGPLEHDAVATYLLEDTGSGWRIESSSLLEYP